MHPVFIKPRQDVELLGPNDMVARCDELALLKAGWMDGEGQAMDKEGLKWFASSWMNSDTQSLPQPYIYPALEGGIRLEWTHKSWEIAAVMDLASKQAELFAVDANSQEFDEETADLSDPAGWPQLISFVSNHLFSRPTARSFSS
jgi:hypothetical protein